MLRRSFLALALLALVSLALPVSGQDKKDDKKDEKKSDDKEKVTLQWKFEKDKTFYQTMKTETKQTMKVMNNEVNQNQNQTFYFSWKPLKAEGDTWTIEQTIEGVQMDIDIGGSKITYDSTKDSTASNPLGDFFKALVGAKFTLTLDAKTMRVTNIEGRDPFVQKLVAANPQMKPLLDKILSKEALIEMADPTFGAAPGHPVAKGDTWTLTRTLDMGPIGKYENTYKYTYEGKDDKKLDKIKEDTALKYIPPPAGQEGVGGLPFRIKGADLKSTNATGSVLFDSQNGRIDHSSMNLDLKGELQIEIGGQTTKVDLSQTQKTTVENSDDNPVKKK